MRQVFDQAGEFAAMNAAEAWCKERGISVGHMERGKPRGLLFGDFDVAKWHNLNAAERTELDGTMTGDMRHGPVFVQLKTGAVAANMPAQFRAEVQE